MQSSLDWLVQNLVGVDDLRCYCGLDTELECIDESYIAYGRCKASQVTQCTVCQSYKAIHGRCKSCGWKLIKHNCQCQLSKKSIHDDFGNLFVIAVKRSLSLRVYGWMKSNDRNSITSHL